MRLLRLVLAAMLSSRAARRRHGRSDWHPAHRPSRAASDATASRLLAPSTGAVFAEKTRRPAGVPDNLAGQAKNLNGVLLDSRASATRDSENPSFNAISYLSDRSQGRPIAADSAEHHISVKPPAIHLG